MEQTQSMEVAILCDEDAAVFTCHFPYVCIGSTTTIEETNVQSARKDVDQLSNQHLRQLFVEEQPHGSGRDGDCSALALCRIGQASANVVLGQLGEIGQQIGF